MLNSDYVILLQELISLLSHFVQHIRYNTNLSICVQHECAQSNLFLNTHLKRIILNTWREKHNVVIYNTIPRIRAKEISYFLYALVPPYLLKCDAYILGSQRKCEDKIGMFYLTRSTDFTK